MTPEQLTAIQQQLRFRAEEYGDFIKLCEERRQQINDLEEQATLIFGRLSKLLAMIEPHFEGDEWKQ